MKKLIITFFLIPLIGFTQSDTTFNANGEIINVAEDGINHLTEKYKTILKTTGGIEGWRLKLKFTSKREDILPYQLKFTKLHPEIPAQIIFESPYYKLTAGNFRTKNEALKTKHKISRNFPGAYPVSIIIDRNLLNE